MEGSLSAPASQSWGWDVSPGWWLPPMCFLLLQVCGLVTQTPRHVPSVCQGRVGDVVPVLCSPPSAWRLVNSVLCSSFQQGPRHGAAGGGLVPGAAGF